MNFSLAISETKKRQADWPCCYQTFGDDDQSCGVYVTRLAAAFFFLI